MKNILSASLILLLTTACQSGLMTRGEIKEVENKKQMQDSVSTLQRTTADTNNRFSEIEGDLRNMYGRIEVVENKLNQSNAEKERLNGASAQSLQEQAQKTQILQDEISRLQEQVGALTAELAAMKSAMGSDTSSANSSAAKKDAFEIGEELFNKKEWKKAILSYQKYRDTNPKGKKFPEATYKMGVCFQEIGLKDEARTFYDEVIAKFPQSGDAKKARVRLKSLKK